MKSGGMGAACKISTLAALNLEMIEAKSEVPSVYPPDGTTFQPMGPNFAFMYFSKPAPSTSAGHRPPTTWPTGALAQTLVNRLVSSWVPRKYMYEYWNVFAAPLLL